MNGINLNDPAIRELFIALIGLIGVMLGAIISLLSGVINEYFARERKDIEDKKALRKSQLHEFYGPTLSLCREVYSKYNLWLDTQNNNAVERNRNRESESSWLSPLPATVSTKNLEQSIVKKLRQIGDMFTKYSGFAEDVNEDALQSLIDFTETLDLSSEDSNIFNDLSEDLYKLPDVLNPLFDNLAEVEALLKSESYGRRFSIALREQPASDTLITKEEEVAHACSP